MRMSRSPRWGLPIISNQDDSQMLRATSTHTSEEPIPSLLADSLFKCNKCHNSFRSENLAYLHIICQHRWRAILISGGKVWFILLHILAYTYPNPYSAKRSKTAWNEYQRVRGMIYCTKYVIYVSSISLTLTILSKDAMDLVAEIASSMRACGARSIRKRRDSRIS